MISEFSIKADPAIGDFPYYCIVLTPEQSKLVENRKISILQIDGKAAFMIKDSDGKDTGERVIYLVFRP